MTQVLTTPTDICNYALAKIGYHSRIGSLFDGSDAAKRALDVYGQTRDSVIYGGDWDFAQRTINGVLLKQAPSNPPSYITNAWTPAYPAVPWAFEYAYPADCIKVRAIKRQPIFIPNWDPRYNRFSVDNDSGLSPPQKVILCNIQNAIIVYAGQVTDPTQWSDAFINILVDELAKAMGSVLIGPQAAKVAMAEEPQDAAIAQQNKQRG